MKWSPVALPDSRCVAQTSREERGPIDPPKERPEKPQEEIQEEILRLLLRNLSALEERALAKSVVNFGSVMFGSL
ncbi:MAG: hypothetical protein ACJA0P_001875 [Planctomycetota bacterium]|jgi:hypothetical protein